VPEPLADLTSWKEKRETNDGMHVLHMLHTFLGMYACSVNGTCTNYLSFNHGYSMYKTCTHVASMLLANMYD